MCITLTKGTFSSRLLLSNQDKGCTPSVAHSLLLPLGPALLNLWTLFQDFARTSDRPPRPCPVGPYTGIWLRALRKNRLKPLIGELSKSYDSLLTTPKSVRIPPTSRNRAVSQHSATSS